MFKNTIQKISEEFLQEAKNSPRLMSDMASMEKYMAESYGDRILIELLQNADDAMSTNVKMIVNDDFVIFANNGKAFDENDVISICRSGASHKIKGVQIGHRGIGFKSTTSMSNDIVIYSNNTYFSFSKAYCAKLLNVNENEVPTIRVPFLINDISNNVKNTLNNLKSEGFTTFFIFNNPKISTIQREIDSFNSSCLLFVNNIKSLEINSERFLDIKLSRKKDLYAENVIITSDGKTSTWWIPKDTFRYFAFKKENQFISFCSNEESVFHNFMPTLEKSPFNFKINAIFPTDPSRKNIILDDETKELIDVITDKLYVIIDNCINKNINPEILKLFLSRNSYTPVAVYLYDVLFKKIKNKLKILTNSGTKVSVVDYELLSDDFNIDEKQLIRKSNKTLFDKSSINNTTDIEEFLSKLSDKPISDKFYQMCLEDKSFVKSTNDLLIQKILTYVVKKTRMQSYISKKDIDFTSIYMKEDDKIISLDKILSNNATIKYLQNSISNDDFQWFVKKINPNNSFKPQLNNKVEILKEDTNNYISKWRSAEQQVVDIENIIGNKAEYVGNQNLGYDVLSKTQNGKNRYIEVKLLSSDKGSFTLTNNEYSSAHQLGKDYYLCLIVQKENEIKAIYINDPIATLKMEKRVKAWEWYCDNFEGDIKIFKLKR